MMKGLVKENRRDWSVMPTFHIIICSVLQNVSFDTGKQTVSPDLSSFSSFENSCHWQYSVTLFIFRELRP